MNRKRLAEELRRLHGETVALAAMIFEDERYGDISDELETAALHLTAAVACVRGDDRGTG